VATTGLSLTVSEINGDFSQLQTAFVFCTPDEGVLLELGISAWGQKLELWGYRAEKNV